MKEVIWYKDPTGTLLDYDRISEIFPDSSAPLQLQLNSIMRFALLYSLLLLLFGRPMHAVYFAIIAALLTYAIWTYDEKNSGMMRKREETLRVERDPASGKSCRSPTKENPFMNVMVTEPTERPKACDVTRPVMRKRVERLFRDGTQARPEQNDLYGSFTSSRQFYTTPNTSTPNDQGGFAKWLYGGGPTCKEDGVACSKRIWVPQELGIMTSP